MSKEWKSGCKRCGKKDSVDYSDRSYVYSLQFGFSRPEYCPVCQKEEVENRKELGVPYFSITVDDSISIENTFGELNHPEKNHQMTETEEHFDQSQFGLTPNKIKELADWFRNQQHRVAVVVGPTGSGKSTALPRWMMDPPKDIGVEQDFFTKEGQIRHTQPRRLSAEGQSRYVGEKLMGGHVGAGFDSGFNYSQNNQSDWRNAWVTETDGMFINEIIQGKISNYGYVIIDEAHERSLNIDKILCLLKERLSLYPKLKVIIASATINAQAFCDFFGNDVAGIIEFEGKERLDKNHNPVSYKVIHPEDSEEKIILPYNNLKKLGKIIVDTAVDKSLWLVNQIISGKKDQGDILVFLQGVNPIDQAVEKTRTILERDDLSGLVEVFPLYRDLSDSDKEKAVNHDIDDGKIHIIFSTNIAEASVTIDSLGYEIETGIENQSIFDSSTNTTHVPLNLISKANCRQRWGRVGRTRNGEVYCLYSKKQFDEIFLEYPISAIKRSSMEELLLDMKTAGINDPSVGWLENPDIEEIDRSKDVLIKIGALSPQGSLLNKGLMLRNFAYPANLVEALLLADELGCLVEMASILPVIKNGGHRKLLDWKYDWDSYTKYDAYIHHKALMSGCRDDIDFVVKILQCGTKSILIDKDKTTNRRLSSDICQEWLEQNYINTEILLEVITERNNLLDQFYEQSGEKDFREIELALLPRVRSILSLIFPEVQASTNIDEYQYDQKSKPKDQSQVSCKCVSTAKPDNDWTKIQKNQPISEIDIFQQLMIDQYFPINSSIIITKSNTENQWIFKDVNLEKYTVQINNLEDCDLIQSESLEVRVIGYLFNNNPTVLVNIIKPPEPFDLFIKKCVIGSNIKVKVLEILNYPNDNSPVIIAQEILSKAKIFINTNDLTFSNSANAVSLIPIGSILDVQVEKIDVDKHWIHISMYKLTEKLLSERLFTKEENKTILARVFKTDVENIQLLLDCADPDIGFLPIITIFSDRLSKKPEEFTLGEEILLSVYRGKKMSKYPFPDMSEKLQQKFKDKRKPSGLSYNNKILEYSDRMSFETNISLKSLDPDLEFHQAIDKIYWLSNRIYLDKVLDVNWFKEAKEKFSPEKVIKGVVQEIIKQSGMTLLVDDCYKAFLPRRQVLNCFSDDLTKWFHVGDTVLSQVTEIKFESKQLILKQLPEDKVIIVLESEPISSPEVVPEVVREIILQPKPAPVSIPKEIPIIPKATVAKTPVVNTPKPIPKTVSKPVPKAPEPEKSMWEKFKKWWVEN